MVPRILVVEDDNYMAEMLCKSLRKHLYEPVRVGTAEEARRLFDIPFDLIVLDLGLPDASGIDLCREVRAVTHPLTAILILTSRDSELDKVLGLESGADDYVTKPFSMAELIARIRALLRRTASLTTDATPVLQVAGIKIDESRRYVEANGKTLTLTAKEFDLLAHFARHPGVVYSRNDLLNVVWGHRRRRDEHAVSCHINRLRAKIEVDPAHPEIIQTVWGVGYRLNPSQPV